ncbi:unnamed protein product [Pelagomonas calceolata]|uniref:Tudor domain-containing protein n=1 Tax=Pelagomonas calceolata TaxID=35677 RepID=A0A8J2WY77_9STRA|nr:unnamed protein product [Pelagomonas calceolata]
MAETPIRFAKGSAVWCQTTPVNYHDAVVLEDCVEGDAEAVVRYTTAARVMRVAVDKVIPIGDARPRRSTTKVAAVSPARAPAAPRRKQPAPKRRLSRGEQAELEQYMRRDKWTTTKTGRDPYYSKPGETRQYRSLLEIARTHYPDVLHAPLDSLQMLDPPGHAAWAVSSPCRLAAGRRIYRRSTPEVSDDSDDAAAEAATEPTAADAAAAAAEPAAAEPAAVDEPAAADAEPAAEAVQPAAEPAAESGDGDSAPAFAVEALVEARFRGGDVFYPALVLVVRDGGKTFDLKYTDGDFEERVPVHLVRPLARRRRTPASAPAPAPPAPPARKRKPAKRAKKAPVATPAPPPPAAVAARPGHEVVGRRVRVWWTDDAAWYAGEVKSFDGEKHAILYDDGEGEALDLSREKHEFVAARPSTTLGRTHRGAPARCYAKGTPQSRGAGVGTSSSDDDSSSSDDEAAEAPAPAPAALTPPPTNESSDDEDVEALRRARRPKQRVAPQPTVEGGVAAQTECERIFGEPDSDAEEREDTASASEPSQGPQSKRQRNDDGFVVYEGFRSFGRANPTVLPVEEPLA